LDAVPMEARLILPQKLLAKLLGLLDCIQKYLLFLFIGVFSRLRHALLLSHVLEFDLVLLV
jgi:hypothetical protein